MSKPKFPLGSVSHGTHRNYDLFFALTGFWNAHIAPENDSYIPVKLFKDWVPDNNPFWGTEHATEMILWLFEQLESVAPDGYFFGAHPGDGSDFGFWEIDVEQA